MNNVIRVRVRRFKVLQLFPAKSGTLALGTIFDVELGEIVQVVEGHFFMRGTARKDGHDFSGARLNFLVKHKHLEELPRRYEGK